MSERVPHILFVCVENSCRSQMAEGFAQALGAGRVAAWSAGSRPAGRINARAVTFMKERGIELTTQRPKGLHDLPAGVTWDFVVTMGCGDACPYLPAKTRLDWDLPDPKGLPDEEFCRVRNAIEARVRELIAEAEEGR
jgi:arsenate reductase